jgi:predicted membrane channel-forming protein YqfA (hemolysin III family)
MGGCVLYSSLYCIDPVHLRAYIAVGSVLSFAAFGMSLAPAFREHVVIRAGLLALMLLAYAAPIMYYNSGRESLTVLRNAIGFLLLGGTAFVTRFPEKFIPKKFDILLNSHSLWHWSCVPFDVMVFMFEWEAIQDLATKQFVCS